MVSEDTLRRVSALNERTFHVFFPRPGLGTGGEVTSVDDLIHVRGHELRFFR